MNNSVVVYWSTPKLLIYPTQNNPFYLNIKEPPHIRNELSTIQSQIKDYSSNFYNCPSFHKSINNTFIIQSPINYSLLFDGTNITSQNYEQTFFDTFVEIRDVDSGLVSLKLFPYIFFCEEDLDIELLPPFLSSSDFLNKCILIPGKYNIGKWFRRLDLSFVFKSKNSHVVFNEYDSIGYVKFNTEKKIIFKKFLYNDNILDIEKCLLNQKYYQYDKNIKTYLQQIYSKFETSKLKNILLKEIKNNLMD